MGRKDGIELGIPTKIGILGVSVSSKVIIALLGFVGLSMIALYFFALKNRGYAVESSPHPEPPQENTKIASPSWI
jgi:hypothetical protein